jgi:peptide/nickel transport system substrate-binding protein
MPATSLNQLEPPSVTAAMFKFDKWDKGQQISFKKDPTSPIQPHVDAYIQREFANQAALKSALLAGEVDFSIFVAPDQVEELKAAGMQIIAYPSQNQLSLEFNTDPAKPAAKFFTDVRVRQALVYALDREAMKKALYFGYADVAHSFIPSYFDWAYNPNLSPKYGYDMTKAKDLLEAAGWKTGSSGLREKDGVPFKFEILSTSGDTVIEKTSATIQQQWKQLGIDATIKTTDPAGRLDNWQNKRQFDLMVTYIVWVPDPDPTVHLHSAETRLGSWNASFYKNPEADRLIETAAATTDREKRKTAYYALEDILARDITVAPLLAGQQIVAANPRVVGLQGNVGTMGVLTRAWLKDVWLKDGK